MIDQVVQHVYLSGAGPVLSDHGKQKLIDLRITHVLTISAVAIPVEHRIQHVDYKFIFAMDMPDQDILSRLEEGLRYIEDAVANSGNVLVHCEAGMSRSVTFVAAYLMRKNKWTAEKALMCIRQSRPSAQPNQGFLQQLIAFESLKYNADSSSLSCSQKYKLWCTGSGNKPQAEAAVAAHEAPSTSEDKPRGEKYRCSRCRQTVFYEEHLIKHNTRDGQPCTFKYVIEPMKWMKTDEYLGKVCCPSCGDKLGSYVWGGRQCQGDNGTKCFEQITPWVHLHKNKIDKVLPPRVPHATPPTSAQTDIPTVIITS